MSSRSTGIAFVMLMVVGGLVLWSLSGSDDAAPIVNATVPPTIPAVVEPAAVAAPANAPVAIDAAVTPAATTERTEAPTPSVDAAKLATIRGRCVDENGAPLASCEAIVGGWTANDERMEAWLRDHPKPEWPKPDKRMTAADGSFAITFWPPPPFQFTLTLKHDARAAMAARWHTIAEGKTVDVGDVVMQPGIRVQGRVVDEAGHPVAKVNERQRKRCAANSRTAESGSASRRCCTTRATSVSRPRLDSTRKRTAADSSANARDQSKRRLASKSSRGSNRRQKCPKAK